MNDQYYDSSKIISSHPPGEVKKLTNKILNKNRPKVLLSLDNLRIVARGLDYEHELYTPDTFEVFTVHVHDDHFTTESKRVLTCLEPLTSGQVTSHIVEFRYGSYKDMNRDGQKSKDQNN